MMESSAIKTPILIFIFATFSFGINIGAQIISTVFYDGPFFIELSILVGTAAGMPPRFILEKRYLFNSESLNHDDNRRLFFMYCGTAVLSTICFWSAEYAFHLIYENEEMRYVGAVIGLTVGFWLKYQLDKNYVFINHPAKAFV